MTGQSRFQIPLCVFVEIKFDFWISKSKRLIYHQFESVSDLISTLIFDVPPFTVLNPSVKSVSETFPNAFEDPTRHILGVSIGHIL